jgi:type III restriction enzyme
MPLWEDHLFVDEKGKFGWKANTWEEAVLELEIKSQGFAGFLRNMSRKLWALCIPFGVENDRGFYPDLLVFHRKKSNVIIDILEPHGHQFADHLPKAQGLARYAKAHGDLFGRIEMIRIVKGKAERLDMQDEKVRSKVLKLTTADQIKDLYTEIG